MAKNLLIVESPAKARTIKKYLGKDFAVKASVGHVVDLPKKRLGVDLDGGFTPEYQVIQGKEKVVRELKKAAKQAEEIYLAPDPDREGEAIAWHIAQELGRPLESYHRVLFHELTKDAIKKAVDRARLTWTPTATTASRPGGCWTAGGLSDLAPVVGKGARRPVGRPGAVGGPSGSSWSASGPSRPLKPQGVLERHRRPGRDGPPQVQRQAGEGGRQEVRARQ